MQFQPNMRQLSRLISRRTQMAFVGGLMLGILIGWLLSPLVGWAVRVGFVVLLLVPLAVAIWFWLNVRRATKEGRATVMRWSSSGIPPTQDDPFGFRRMQQHDAADPDIIDVDELDRGSRP